jgi:glutaredoxin
MTPRAFLDIPGAMGYNGPSIMAHVTVYSKPGCHLCEEAIRLLQRVQKQHPFELEEINIQDDPTLLSEYGEQIPVVTLNGTFLFEYAVDETRLRQLLKEVN